MASCAPRSRIGGTESVAAGAAGRVTGGGVVGASGRSGPGVNLSTIRRAIACPGASARAAEWATSWARVASGSRTTPTMAAARSSAARREARLRPSALSTPPKDRG